MARQKLPRVTGKARSVVGTLVKAGRYQEAIAKGEEEVRAGSSNDDVKVFLAKAYLEQGQPHLCSRLVEQVTSAKPLSGQASTGEGVHDSLSPDARTLLRDVSLALQGLEPLERVSGPALERGAVKGQEQGHAQRPPTQRSDALPAQDSTVAALTPGALDKGQSESLPAQQAESPSVGNFREEAVALEENPLTSAPVQSFDDMVIEAAAEEDDDPTEETYVVAQGMGVGGVGLKLFPRQPSYQDEDDEVVVIERETGTQRARGSNLWLRVGEPRSWKASAARTYGFDEDDDKATEIVQRSGEGYSSRTRLHADPDEDDLVVSAHQTGSNRYKPYIPTALSQEPEPPAPPPSNLLNEIEAALAAQASAASTVEPRDDEGLELEELDDVQAPKRSVRGTGEGPVARLAPTPAAPLRPSVAPPFTRPPVPILPSQVGRESAPAVPTPSLPSVDPNELDSPASVHVLPPGAEALSRAQNAAPRSSQPTSRRSSPNVQVGQGGTAAGSTQADRAGSRTQTGSQQYFKRSSRQDERNWGPILLTGVLTGALLAGGYWVSSSRESHQVANLQEGVLSALERGSHTGMLVALNDLQTGPKESDDVKDLSSALTWMLWGQEGVKLGDSGPDPKHLDEVQPLSPLPMVVARAERDLLQGDILAGAQRVKEAQVGHEEEPVLALLLGRFALEKASFGAGGADEADAYLKKALGLLSAEAHPTFPVAKVAVLQAMARLQVLQAQGKADPAVYKPVLDADGAYAWALLEQGVASLDPKLSADDADKALKSLQVSLKDKLSPRQQSWLALTRAQRALTAEKLDAGSLLLQEAARTDASWPDPLVAMGQLMLDQGHIKGALEKLEKAYAIAPLSLKVLPVYASALIEDTRLAAARDIVATLPDAYQELSAVRLIKARLAREVGDFNGAEAQVGAGLKLRPEDFSLQLEQAQILFAQKKPEAAGLVDALTKTADDAGRPAVISWLNAEKAALTDSASQVKSLSASPDVTARALLVLADVTLEKGDAAGAEGLLLKSRAAGDLPQVVLNLARLQGVVPEKREGARNDLQQLVQGRCGDSPICQQGTQLLEQLH